MTQATTLAAIIDTTGRENKEPQSASLNDADKTKLVSAATERLKNLREQPYPSLPIRQKRVPMYTDEDWDRLGRELRGEEEEATPVSVDTERKQ